MALDIDEGSVCIAFRHKDGDTRLVARYNGRSSVLQTPRFNCTNNDDILKRLFPESGKAAAADTRCRTNYLQGQADRQFCQGKKSRRTNKWIENRQTKYEKTDSHTIRTRGAKTDRKTVKKINKQILTNRRQR
jgi:hypothetical protein